MNTNIVLLSDLMIHEFAQIALISAALIGAICGLLSPLVVYKNRAYVGDTLAHLVFPGVVAGIVLANGLNVSAWASMFVGAAVSALVGSVLSEKLYVRSGAPHDSISVTILTGFFGIGILGFHAKKNQLAAIDFEQILFGDILALAWRDSVLLGAVFLIVLTCLVVFREDFQAWVTDAEFAEISGYRTRTLESLFPVLITLTVLSGMFAVGVLLVSSLLAIPSLLVRPNRVFSLKSVFCGGFVTSFGLLMAFQFDTPVGATVVSLGLVLVCAKYLIFG